MVITRYETANVTPVHYFYLLSVCVIAVQLILSVCVCVCGVDLLRHTWLITFRSVYSITLDCDVTDYAR